MATITIARMVNRLRMDPAIWNERARIGRIFDAAIFDLLEQALADAGVDTTGELCIRRVDAFLRIRLRGTDRSVADAWSQALAKAIGRAALTAHPDIVRYRSRAQALEDVVCSVARRDFSRAWAWRQLELWSAPEQPSTRDSAHEVLNILTRHPRLALAVMAKAGGTVDLRPLLSKTTHEEWLQLASAILIELTGSDALLEIESAPSETLRERAPGDIEDRRRLAARIVAQARMLAGFKDASDDASRPLSVRRCAALLAIAEVEPWRLRDEASAALLVTETVRALQRPEPRAEDRSPSPVTPDEAEPGDDRAAQTDFGGLLFLLRLVGECGLPQCVIEDPALNSRSLRWGLHQIAMLMTGCEGTDPAALAFVGLAPAAVPPHLDAPPTDEENLALARYARRILEGLLEEFADEEPRDPLELIAWLTQRHADIVADPGWIEARFRHNSADTTIRRLGLDRDPDFLPWLGVVVRFAYV